MKQRMLATRGLSRKEWLQLRRTGIGGSDASVIMNVNPYRSRLQLWEEKMGQVPVVEEGNEYTYWGEVMEPIVRKEFSRRTGLRVRQKHAMIFHPEIPYLFANLDGIVTDETGEACIFEAKTASQYQEARWQEGNLPQAYLLQLQHYLEVTGMRKAFIAALIGGNQFVFHTVYRDEDLIQELLAKEQEFWACVQNRERPQLDGNPATTAYLNQKFGQAIPERITLDASFSQVLSEYDRISQELERLQYEKEQAVNQLKAGLQEYEQGILGERIISWKEISRTSLDAKRLKREQPEIFAQYQNQSSYRRLTVA